MEKIIIEEIAFYFRDEIKICDLIIKPRNEFMLKYFPTEREVCLSDCKNSVGEKIPLNISLWLESDVLKITITDERIGEVLDFFKNLVNKYDKLLQEIQQHELRFWTI